MSQFLQLRDEASGRPLADDHIVDLVLNFLLAGRWGPACLPACVRACTACLHACLACHACWAAAPVALQCWLTCAALPCCRDSTANVLCWMLHELQLHPEVEGRMLQEVQQVLAGQAQGQQAEADMHMSMASNGISTPPGMHELAPAGVSAAGAAAGAEPVPVPAAPRVPTYEEVKQMRYCKAVMMETLRLHPSAPRLIKFAVADDTLPDGSFVPAGSCVFYSPYIMGHSEAIWGVDVEEFRPDRWLAGVKNSFSFPAFNAGPRLCLGKGLAELEGVFVLACLLQRYRLREVEGLVVAPRTTITLPMQEGLRVTVSRR